MITVIKKELLDYLQSIQFIALLVISIVLFLANGLVFSGRYGEQLDQYNQKMAEYSPSTVDTKLYRNPSQLQFIADGGDKSSPYGYSLMPRGNLSPLAAGPRNFKLPDIPEPDWAFTVKIIFSLYVLLLGYRAVSGEREQGTLRQTLANPISRSRLLAAKYAAIILAVTVPLVTGMLVSLIAMGISDPLLFQPVILNKIILMFVLSFFYLSLFAFLSLLVSSLIRQSSLALLVLLSLWLLAAVVIPNTSGILAERFSKAPSEYQTAKLLTATIIKEQVFEKAGKILEKANAGEFETEEELKQETDRAFDEGQQEIIRHRKIYENAMNQRQATARNISRISPSALFQYASESLAGTGFESEKRFMYQVRAYSEIYDSYILEKTGKLLAGSGWSFSRNFTFKGKQIFISSPQPEEYQGDKSDFPRFAESRHSVAQSLQFALLDLSGLILWNLVLAISAFAVFSRSDVR